MTSRHIGNNIELIIRDIILDDISDLESDLDDINTLNNLEQNQILLNNNLDNSDNLPNSNNIELDQNLSNMNNTDELNQEIEINNNQPVSHIIDDLFRSNNLPEELRFLNNDYLENVNIDIYNHIVSVIIPYLFQWDHLNTNQFYVNIINYLYNDGYEYDDIYYTVAYYITHNQDNYNELIDYIRRYIADILINIRINHSNTPGINQLAQNTIDNLTDNENTQDIQRYINRRNQFIRSNITNINNIITNFSRTFSMFNEIPQNLESVKLVVPQEELDKNIIVEFKNLDEEIRSKNEMCTVCQYKFNNDDKVRHLNWCCHVFHHECIDSWLLNSSHICPNCKKESPVYRPLL